MASIDSYHSFRKQIDEGVDDDGKFKLYEIHIETPCNCHPETCCCGGKSWKIRKFKIYENGTRVSVD